MEGPVVPPGGRDSQSRCARQRPVIGLVGQVCAGKSVVAEAFRRLGAVVCDADRMVHELYARPDVAADVRRLFGASVMTEQGNVDRKALGKLVFSEPAKLRTLTEQVVFPRVGQAVLDATQRFRASREPALLLDAPTLFEAGRAGACDQIVFVAAPLSRRQAWAGARGWEPGELERREALLGSEELKRRNAAAVINNDGSREMLEQRVGELFHAWTAPAVCAGASKT